MPAFAKQPEVIKRQQELKYHIDEKQKGNAAIGRGAA